MREKSKWKSEGWKRSNIHYVWKKILHRVSLTFERLSFESSTSGDPFRVASKFDRRLHFAHWRSVLKLPIARLPAINWTLYIAFEVGGLFQCFKEWCEHCKPPTRILMNFDTLILPPPLQWWKDYGLCPILHGWFPGWTFPRHVKIACWLAMSWWLLNWVSGVISTNNYFIIRGCSQHVNFLSDIMWLSASN